MVRKKEPSSKARALLSLSLSPVNKKAVEPLLLLPFPLLIKQEKPRIEKLATTLCIRKTRRCQRGKFLGSVRKEGKGRKRKKAASGARE